MKRAILCGVLWAASAGAQCAMCYRTAQSLSAARGRALNSAIFVLGAPPVVLVAGFAVLLARRRGERTDASEVCNGEDHARRAMMRARPPASE